MLERLPEKRQQVTQSDYQKSIKQEIAWKEVMGVKRPMISN